MTVVGRIGSTAQADRLALRQVPMILMYHAVDSVNEDPNQVCVSPSRFAQQMAWLARRGLRGVDVSTLVDAMGKAQHRNMVGITFDDGFVSVLDHALPALQRHGFGATVFVVSGRLDASNDWEEPATPSWPLLSARGVQTLAAAGIEIGSHGVNHVRLAGARRDDLVHEVATSKAELAVLVGSEIRGFAYPYGSMDGAAWQAVRDAGYDYACAVQATPQQIGMVALPRVYVGQSDTALRMTVKQLVYRPRIAMRGKRP